MKKVLTRKLVEGIRVPPETFQEIPVGTFRGKGEFLLENHRGILAYREDLISIAVKRGTVLIHGRDLLIANMNRKNLCVRGMITMIELE